MNAEGRRSRLTRRVTADGHRWPRIRKRQEESDRRWKQLDADRRKAGSARLRMDRIEANRTEGFSVAEVAFAE